jgi:hypothetical protein
MRIAVGLSVGMQHRAGTPAPGPVNTAAPANTGADAIVGTTRTSSTGTWTGTGIITYAYQWQRDGVAIVGAITNTYVLAEADVGSSVRCLVSATDSAGTRSAASNAVTVEAVISDVTAPVITGLATDTTTDPNNVGISFTVSENCNIYGIYTVDSDQTGITGSNIIAGKLADGITNAPLAFGPTAVTAPAEVIGGNITTLGDGLVRLYIVGRDAALNVGTPVVASWTRDTTAPVISGVSATPGNTQILFNWSTDTAEGTARVVAVPNAATAPTPAEILAGQKSGGVAADAASAPITVTASGAQTTVTLTGLTNATAYDVYIAHEDVPGNVDTDSVLNVTPVAGVGGNPTFVSSATSGTSTASTSFVASLPAIPTIGNWQTLAVGTAFHTTVVDTPVGWTAVASQDGPSTTIGLYIFERLITAGNVAETTVTLTSLNTQVWSVGVAETANTSGHNAASISQGLGTSATSHTGRSMTTTAANVLVYEFSCLRNGDSPSATPGFNQQQTNCAFVAGYQTKATAGATTGLAFTTIDSESGGFSQITIEMVA